MIEGAVLGDCAIVVKSRNGGLLRIDDPRMAEFDAGVLREIVDRMREGASFDQALSDAIPQLRVNRAKANREDTYWIVGNDEHVADELVSRIYPLEEVHAVLVCTDGFARIVEVFHAPSDYLDLLL
jgi:hypothetical protein